METGQCVVAHDEISTDVNCGAELSDGRKFSQFCTPKLGRKAWPICRSSLTLRMGGLWITMIGDFGFSSTGANRFSVAPRIPLSLNARTSDITPRPRTLFGRVRGVLASDRRQRAWSYSARCKANIVLVPPCIRASAERGTFDRGSSQSSRDQSSRDKDRSK